MVKKVTTEVDSDRPTYASDFIKSDIEEVVFLGDPILDNLLTTVMALTAELWADRRRNLVIQRLLADRGITSEMIETYMPTEEEEAAWEAERDRYVDAVMSPMLRRGHIPVATKFEGDE